MGDVPEGDPKALVPGWQSTPRRVLLAGMTILPPEPPASAPGQLSTPYPVSDAPRARRSADHGVLAGVAAGIADHLGWPVALVRGVFVALGFMQMVGVFLYGLLWVLMPPAEAEQSPVEAPGLESASRRGMRGSTVAHTGPRADRLALAGLAVCGLGVAVLAQALGTGPSSTVFWPLLFATAGLALVWRQADRTPGGARWATGLRVSFGMGLVGVAVSIIAALQIGLAELPIVLGLSALMVAGVGIAAAPWVTKWQRRARSAHERALLEEARADMAAHLHDSVLQTLALIQRQADDPKAVASLARRQERELRAWLYGNEPVDDSLKAALTRAAGEVEDERGVEVELVVVGDCPLDDGTTALVRAAREAITNAAKHSGVPRIDVYCEVDEGHVECFVRDRGVGFAPDLIADDRMGVRRSIVERMQRHGGQARIRTAPGEGTEVRLDMDTRKEQS